MGLSAGTTSSDAVIDGGALLEFMGWVISRDRSTARRQVAELRERLPQASRDDLANQLIFSEWGFSTIKSLSMAEMVKIPGFGFMLQSGDISVDFVAALQKQMLVVMQMEEVFQVKVPGAGIEEIILALLLDVRTPLWDELLKGKPIAEIQGKIAALSRAKLATEILTGALKRSSWKRPTLSKTLGSPLLATIYFLQVRNTALAAKYLCNDGIISDTEFRQFRVFQQNVLHVVLRLFMQLARTDGELHPDERSVIINFCEMFGLEIPAFLPGSGLPGSGSELVAALPGIDQRRFLMRCMVDVVMADAVIDEREAAFVKTLADLLEVEPPNLVVY